MRDIKKKKIYAHGFYLRNKDDVKRKTGAYAKQHRKEANLNHERFRLKIRRKVLGYYSNGTFRCACCGESELSFLSIDHINGRKKDDRLSGFNFYYSLYRQNFPPGFQVLCFNCNMAKGLYSICPHQRNSKRRNFSLPSKKW